MACCAVVMGRGAAGRLCCCGLKPPLWPLHSHWVPQLQSPSHCFLFPLRSRVLPRGGGSSLWFLNTSRQPRPPPALFLHHGLTSAISPPAAARLPPASVTTVRGRSGCCPYFIERTLSAQRSFSCSVAPLCPHASLARSHLCQSQAHWL